MGRHDALAVRDEPAMCDPRAEVLEIVAALTEEQARQVLAYARAVRSSAPGNGLEGLLEGPA